MHLKSVPKTVSALSLGVVLPLFAIERPVPLEAEENESRNPSAESVQSIEKNRNIAPPEVFDFDKTPVEKVIPLIEEEVAWLGVGSSPISPVFGSHLGLDHGLSVDVISPGSPADEFGLKEHDVLLEVDGVALKNRRDLQRLIESKKPGDEVKVSYLRRGERGESQVKLAKRESVPASSQNRGLQGSMPYQLQQFLNQGDLGEMMQQMEERMKQFDQNFFGGQSDPHDRIRQLLDNAGHGVSGMFQQSGSFKLMDAEGTIEMSVNNGQQEVRVTDQAGNELYSGPFETDEDKAAMPDDVRRRVEGMSFEMGGGTIDGNFLDNLFGK